MAWGQLAPDLSPWALPAKRSKNRKAHVAHLAEPARAASPATAAAGRANLCSRRSTGLR